MDQDRQGGLDVKRRLRVKAAQEVRTVSVDDRDPAPKRGSGLTPAIIEELKSKGLNQAQIARRFGVTRQAVSVMKRKYGRFSQTPRERALELFPWKVPAQMQESSPDKRMRDHAEYVATGGKGMSQWKLERLAAFYEMLDTQDMVVEFDPEVPPSPGIKYGGYRYVPREDSDGDLMIRVNQHTNVNDEGRMLWRIPKRRPKV